MQKLPDKLDYGKLTIQSYYDSHNGRRRYLCLCTCGNTKIAKLHDMKNNNTLSCGCLKKESGKRQAARFKTIDDIGTTQFSKIKYCAVARKIEFSVSREYIWSLYLKQNKKCALSGLHIYFSEYSEGDMTASLDRIDSSKGYIEGNVQWVHKHINLMKLNHTEEYFLSLCASVVNHSKSPAQNDRC